MKQHSKGTSIFIFSNIFAGRDRVKHHFKRKPYTSFRNDKI